MLQAENIRSAHCSLRAKQIFLSLLVLPKDSQRSHARECSQRPFVTTTPARSPSTGLSEFRQSARGGRKCQCKQTLTRHVPRVMTSLLMSSSPIIISHLLFPRRYSNSRHVAKSASSSSRRVAKAPRRACSHANRLQAHAPWTRVSSQEVFGDLR